MRGKTENREKCRVEAGGKQNSAKSAGSRKFWVAGIEKYVTRKRAAAVLLLLAAFFAGNLAAAVQDRLTKDPEGERESVAASLNLSGEEAESVGRAGEYGTRPVYIDGAQAQDGGSTDPNTAVLSRSAEGLEASAEILAQYLDGTAANVEAAAYGAEGTALWYMAEGNWGLSFQEEGEPPVANASFEELAQYDAYYAQDTEEKVLYLTFDCGYENGNTPKILEALKKHHAPAAFFVVGNFIEDNPELVRQMAEEGHTVCNHSLHHPDMSQMDRDSFAEELSGLEELYREATGQQMVKYYRPPQGKYSEGSLKLAQELGYKTFFWSLAYVDWYTDQQPTREEAFEKLLGRIHPGAIVLLHNTSSTNGEILDELLTKWEEMGYRFHALGELAG